MRPIERLIDAELLKHEMIMESLKPILARRNVLGIIDDAPTIEAEPVRRGRWIDHQYKEFPIGRYECSVCGARHDMPWDYCPNCGARMEAEE